MVHDYDNDVCAKAVANDLQRDVTETVALQITFLGEELEHYRKFLGIIKTRKISNDELKHIAATVRKLNIY